MYLYEAVLRIKAKLEAEKFCMSGWHLRRIGHREPNADRFLSPNGCGSHVDTLFKIKPFSIIFNHEFSEIGMA
jgi:hypothetical protein